MHAKAYHDCSNQLNGIVHSHLFLAGWPASLYVAIVCGKFALVRHHGQLSIPPPLPQLYRYSEQ